MKQWNNKLNNEAINRTIKQYFEQQIQQLDNKLNNANDDILRKELADGVHENKATSEAVAIK